MYAMHHDELREETEYARAVVQLAAREILRGAGVRRDAREAVRR
jgi:hypothetical protein